MSNKKVSSQTVFVPIGENTPKNIPAITKRILNWKGVFYRAVETYNLIYFVNYKEGDENGNTILYRKNGMELASDNWFASNDLVGLMLERESEITYLSPTAKIGLRDMKKDYQD